MYFFNQNRSDRIDLFNNSFFHIFLLHFLLAEINLLTYNSGRIICGLFRVLT